MKKKKRRKRKGRKKKEEEGKKEEEEEKEIRLFQIRISLPYVSRMQIYVCPFVLTDAVPRSFAER